MTSRTKRDFSTLVKLASASEEFPRHSEASLISLGGEKLLLAWGRKPGGDDFSSGSIVGMFSVDAGRSWDDNPFLIQEKWPGIFDVMSPNLIRTNRGIHHLFAGRHSVAEGESLYSAKLSIFQTISTDEGMTWSSPTIVSIQDGYNILVNARVVVLGCGRIIVPVAFVSGPIFKEYDRQRVFCYYSDDEGHTWLESNHLNLPDAAIMEPSVVECKNDSLYMSLRTKLGYLYEARSNDKGTSWISLSRSSLPSAEAPSTLIRSGTDGILWMFWCNTPYVPGRSKWFERYDIAWACSCDDGQTWSSPVPIEHAENRSFGYVNANIINEEVFLTYYDWLLDEAKPHFWGTSLRQKILALDWFKGMEPKPIL